ncbi:MAG: hypothetical protein DYG89_28630 [Caldilinea sp. CFX5]|nr:hypothetical protein [Caldilinea sp. CFX5]
MLTRKLLTFVDLRAGEGYLVGLIVGYTFCSYATDLLIYTTAYTLFLNAFDAQRLPYIYIGVSLGTVLLAALYLRLNQRYTLAQLLAGQSALLLLTIIGYRSGLSFAPNRWLLFSLPVWYGVVNALLYLTYWNLVGRLFNLQQGKRLFGLFGAATQITGLLVGFLTPGLVMLVGPPNLLWIAAVTTGGALAFLMTLIRQNAALSILEPAADEIEPTNQPPPLPLRSESYVQLIFVLLTCYALGAYFIDNIFYNRVESHFADANAMAGFLGLFNGVNSGLSLLVQLWLANRLLNRYGVRAMVMLTPLLLTVGMLLFVMTGLTLGATAQLFWLITLIYLVMQVLADTDNTAANLLYQPLPAGLRTRLQTIADGIVSPSAVGLTGLLLLLLTEFFQATVLQLAAVALPILAGWALAGWALGRGYGQRVQQALRQRLIQGQRTFIPDHDSLAIIRQNLSNPQPGAALYALDLLAAADSRALAQALPQLLNHPSAPVRLEALQRLERVDDADALPLLRHCYATDVEPTVRHAALRALAALGGLTHLDEMEGYLQSPDLDQRQSVLVGLLRSGDLDAILTVGEALGRLIQSPERAERLLAARLLGESGVTSFYRPLLRLIHDPDLAVQRAALIAAGKLQQPKLWPAVMVALRDPQTRAAAHRALSLAGEAALPYLNQALTECRQATLSPTYQERRFLVEIVRLFGRIRTQAASASLVSLLSYPDRQVHTQLLYTLQQRGYQATSATRPLIEAQLQAELAHAAWTLAGLVDLAQEGGASPVDLVRRALLNSLTQQRVRLFFWLTLLDDNPALAPLRDLFGVGQGYYRQLSAEQRAYALETLDLVAPKAVTRHLLPLLDELPLDQQYARLAGAFPQPTLTGPERLQTILTGAAAWVDSWLRAVALYSAATMTNAAAEAAPALRSAATSLCATADPLLCETATWAQRRLTVTTPIHQPAPPVEQGETTMLLTIEKVMILKTVDIFADTPDEILVEVALLLKEMALPAGVLIFEKGAPGDSMYLIVEGEVEAYDGAHVFTRMGAREVFGEMALLDGEPRTASIRTTQPTQLLRLEQEPFYELMDDRIEIARGIIHVLLQRLRLRTNDVHNLLAQLDEMQAAQ